MWDISGECNLSEGADILEVAQVSLSLDEPDSEIILFTEDEQGNSDIDTVAQLSEFTSPELRDIILSVVHGLLATLSPKMHSKPSTTSENATVGTANDGSEDCAEVVENSSLQFQPFISLTRDYLARLLFWCMLLGHYLRGLEYRMDLTELLSLTIDAENDVSGNEQIV